MCDTWHSMRGRDDRGHACNPTSFASTRVKARPDAYPSPLTKLTLRCRCNPTTRRVQADKDGDGAVNQDEFIRIMRCAPVGSRRPRGACTALFTLTAAMFACLVSPSLGRSGWALALADRMCVSSRFYATADTRARTPSTSTRTKTERSAVRCTPLTNTQLLLSLKVNTRRANWRSVGGCLSETNRPGSRPRRPDADTPPSRRSRGSFFCLNGRSRSPAAG